MYDYFAMGKTWEMRGKRIDQVPNEGKCRMKTVGKASLTSSWVEETGKGASNSNRILASSVAAAAIQSNTGPAIASVVDNNVPAYCS